MFREIFDSKRVVLEEKNTLAASQEFIMHIYPHKDTLTFYDALVFSNACNNDVETIYIKKIDCFFIFCHFISDR